VVLGVIPRWGGQGIAQRDAKGTQAAGASQCCCMMALFALRSEELRMDPSTNDREENRRLRRTMRDLVALSTLPAVWVGLDPGGIVRSLADVLSGILSLDFVYARVADPGGKAVEACRVKGSAAVDVERARAVLAPLHKSHQTVPTATIQDPFGSAELRVAVTRFGVGDDSGVLVAGSGNPDFPTEQDRLLLGVGANQTAIVLHRRRAGEQVQEQREWLRVTLASIGDAVIATDTQGRVTFLNFVAEELTGWTFHRARLGSCGCPSRPRRPRAAPARQGSRLRAGSAR
jgi:PAS domain-containing protein